MYCLFRDTSMPLKEGKSSGKAHVQETTQNPLLAFFYSFLSSWEIPVCPIYMNQQMVLQYTKYLFPWKGKTWDRSTRSCLWLLPARGKPLPAFPSRQPGAIANAACAVLLPPEGGRMSPSLFPNIRRSCWWGGLVGTEGKVSGERLRAAGQP